jgi:glycosyltransferase involved in cell wall biosynthesis
VRFISSKDQSIDVVIPARNEAQTIGPIVAEFVNHPAINYVIVTADADTTDDTENVAFAAMDNDIEKGWVIANQTRGKGQGVAAALRMVQTEYVIFCDADITGLTYDHISLLICDAVIGKKSITIGVPDIPNNYPAERIWAWKWVSGQRCVPTALVRPLQLHGYLMETQINRAAKWARLPITFEWLRGITSKYQMTELRIQEMERDREWARQMGIL